MKYVSDPTPAAPAVKSRARPLTTTSYALLGLLSVQPWSAYELTRQMRRSLRFHWPRAETRVYAEPSNLVAHGLATSRTEHRGRRVRTVYSITDNGRTALRSWLAEPCEPPRLEAEALLRSMFAESGSKDDLLRSLAQLADQADAARADLLGQAADYLATGGPFPGRLHLIALNGRFLLAFTQLLGDWAREAAAEVATWTDTGPLDPAVDRIAVFRKVLGDSLVREVKQAGHPGTRARTPAS
jgi:DNA-binding PadR family transcriptional regulator